MFAKPTKSRARLCLFAKLLNCYFLVCSELFWFCSPVIISRTNENRSTSEPYQCVFIKRVQTLHKVQHTCPFSFDFLTDPLLVAMKPIRKMPIFSGCLLTPDIQLLPGQQNTCPLDIQTTTCPFSLQSKAKSAVGISFYLSYQDIISVMPYLFFFGKSRCFKQTC